LIRFIGIDTIVFGLLLWHHIRRTESNAFSPHAPFWYSLFNGSNISPTLRTRKSCVRKSYL